MPPKVKQATEKKNKQTLIKMEPFHFDPVRK